MTKILSGMIVGDKSQLSFPEASGTYHMTASGQTTWYEFANATLEEARRAPLNLPWLTSATKGRPLIARRVVPISSEEFRPPVRRPVNSVLSNVRLNQAFGVTLPDWRTQLQRCFPR